MRDIRGRLTRGKISLHMGQMLTPDPVRLDELVSLVCEALNRINLERDVPVGLIHQTTAPLGAIDGFDSLNAVEVGVDLAESLKLKIPETPPLFGTAQQPRTIEEIATALYHLEANKR